MQRASCRLSQQQGPRPSRRGSASSRASPAASDAAPLKSSSDLLKDADGEEQRAKEFNARAEESTQGTFERRLGSALVENAKAKAARAASAGKAAIIDMMREWDKNRDGKISRIELRQACRNDLGLKATNAEIDQLFEDFDADGSGSLELNEMKPCLVALQDAATAAHKEALQLNTAAARCRARAVNLREAAKTMADVEAAHAKVEDEYKVAADLGVRLGEHLAKRSLKVDLACRNWPEMNREGKVSAAQFVQGVLALKLSGEVDEAEVRSWFASAYHRVDPRVARRGTARSR